MTGNLVSIALLSAAIVGTSTAVAQADCESDMIQLEQAYKAPKLTPTATAALDEAKTKSVAAMKKDDDTTCHKAIADGMGKAGMVLK